MIVFLWIKLKNNSVISSLCDYKYLNMWFFLIIFLVGPFFIFFHSSLSFSGILRPSSLHLYQITFNISNIASIPLSLTKKNDLKMISCVVHNYYPIYGVVIHLLIDLSCYRSKGRGTHDILVDLVSRSGKSFFE